MFVKTRELMFPLIEPYNQYDKLTNHRSLKM